MQIKELNDNLKLESDLITGAIRAALNDNDQEAAQVLLTKLNNLHNDIYNLTTLVMRKSA